MFLLELLGTVAFSISGAIEAMKKGMDMLGVLVLGIVTAVGGGILRDIIIGILPPTLSKIPAMHCLRQELLFWLFSSEQLLQGNRKRFRATSGTVLCSCQMR